MSTAQAISWVDKIKTGAVDLSDLESLDNVALEEVVEQLRPAFPVCFLDRRLRDKREIGLAQKWRSYASKQGPAQSSQVFRNCRLLTCETGNLTTVTTMTFLRVRPSSQKPESLELDSGAGYSLYRDPDGWKIKLMEERTVHLPVPLLKKHGWLIEPLSLHESMIDSKG